MWHFDDDDITPIEGPRPPRGRAQRGSVSVALDACSGSFEGSDMPTTDPPDFACKRVRHASWYAIVKRSK